MRKDVPHIYTIIVNWNGRLHILKCLQSLTALRIWQKGLSVVVVDNASSDDSVTLIRKSFPAVTVLEMKSNKGFTGGNNIGISYALAHGAEYIWLLNNDTVVDKNVLSVISAFDDPTVGACGSKIYFAKGHEYHGGRYKEQDRGKVIWYAGGKIDWENMYASHKGVDEIDRGQYDKSEETDYITGCSFFIRSTVLRTIGVFDEQYYLYLEDLDLSLRIQRGGWKTLYVPSSVVWHMNAGSSGRPGNILHEYYITRNRLLVGLKYAKLRTKIALLLEGVRFILKGTKIQRKAIIDALFHRFGKQYEPKTIS
jgi:GT2 family glycosyltransferase